MVQLVLESARWVERGTQAVDAGRELAACEFCWSVILTFLCFIIMLWILSSIAGHCFFLMVIGPQARLGVHERQRGKEIRVGSFRTSH